MEAVGEGDLQQQHAADAHHIGPFDDDQTGRDVPQFVFPRTGEEYHEENPMEPLLETGALGGDDDARPVAFAVDRGDEALGGDGGDVDAKYAVKEPTGLAVDQVDRPYHQPIHGLADGPVAQGLPAEIEEMETDNQNDKQPYVNRVAVLWVVAIGLDVGEGHSE